MRGFLLSGAAIALMAASEPMAPVDYGSPISYDDAVQVGEKYIKASLLDPYSAHIDWSYNFVPFTEKVPFFKRTTGYASCVTVNAKNAYGGYVGEKTYRIIIRDGRVIDYMPVSDLKFVPDICKELADKYGMSPAPNPRHYP